MALAHRGEDSFGIAQREEFLERCDALVDVAKIHLDAPLFIFGKSFDGVRAVQGAVNGEFHNKHSLFKMFVMRKRTLAPFCEEVKPITAILKFAQQCHLIQIFQR